MWYAEPGRGRAGFTLVEVLVALVLAVMLGGVIFQVVQGESRFATVQSAREEVQQNARGALEIVASELRSAHRQGLVAADTNQITFLLPRIWGISCGNASATSLSVVFPNAGGTAFTLNEASGLMADSTSGNDWGPNPVSTARAVVTGLAAVNLGASGNPCAAVRSTAGTNLVAYTLTGTGFPASVPAGRTVYLYQLMRYDVGQVGSEWWVRRSNGTPGGSNQQPLAGPLNDQNGLAFMYFDETGTRIAQPVNTFATLKTVARIKVTVNTRSRAQGRANLTETQSTSILLRNQ